MVAMSDQDAGAAVPADRRGTAARRGWISWLATRVEAIDERSLERTREKIRTGSTKGPDGKVGSGGVLIWLVMLVFPFSQAVSGRHGPVWLLVPGMVVFGALFAAIMATRPAGRWRLARYAMLLPLVALGLALAHQLGTSGTFLVVFPSMATAMVLPIAAPAFLGVVTVTVLSVAATVAGHNWDAATSVAMTAFLSGFVMFILRRLFTTIGLLREARNDLAHAAVAEERLRFSRDLHDLLGHTLSVVVVKAEVVRRLSARDPERAAEAAADIETIGRQALAEVREAVTGYRTRGLSAELDGARTALAGAGITPVVRRTTVELDEQADALLAWAVREGTTNVIRHSGAGRCTITLSHADGTVELRVADDGTGGDGHPLGNGLRGLTERFDAAGGTVHASAGPDGFTLTVTVPAAVGKMCR
ncbi:sensor histidine kinase [Actinocatenispora rupis]|uniref:Two-component sensor histidine kinase n=2 Tax=Actinocatenispora rupis TaxID=519421 RepID=A0A8J3NFD6_9ACTN|nr:two-component sensor histidine kinase [Actinocatenispora rupis]